MSGVTQIDESNLDQVLRDPLSADSSAFDKLFAQDAASGTVPNLDDKAESGSSSLDGDGDTETQNNGTSSQSTAAPKGDELDGGNAVIKSADGKNEIPFAVLQAERERARQAEENSRKLQAQLTELTAKVAASQEAANKGVADRTPATSEIISEAELAALREEAPTLAKVFDGLIRQIEELRPVAARVQENEQLDAATRAQKAIDSIPRLVYVQSTDPAKFDAICQIDAWAMTQDWAKGLTLEQRYEKSLGMYEAVHGKIELPASANGGKVDPKAAGAKAAADAAIAAAMSNAVPNTLTDLPGGNPPASNFTEQMEGMSAAALTEQFMRMTPAEMEKALARFA